MPISIALYEFDPAKLAQNAGHFRYAAGGNSGLHEGPLGVVNGTLEESTYKDLKEKGNKNYDVTAASWMGITDKYWLSALIPGGPQYKATFSNYSKGDEEHYQVDYLGRARFHCRWCQHQKTRYACLPVQKS